MCIHHTFTFSLFKLIELNVCPVRMPNPGFFFIVLPSTTFLSLLKKCYSVLLFWLLMIILQVCPALTKWFSRIRSRWSGSGLPLIYFRHKKILLSTISLRIISKDCKIFILDSLRSLITSQPMDFPVLFVVLKTTRHMRPLLSPMANVNSFIPS